MQRTTAEFANSSVRAMNILLTATGRGAAAWLRPRNWPRGVLCAAVPKVCAKGKVIYGNNLALIKL
jgi:hypothetical protein